jgi:hypothetical protein
MGETMSTFPLVRTGCLLRCILAVLLGTVAGGMPLLGTPGWRTDAQPWRTAAPSPQCGTGLPHIPHPCGSLYGVAALSSTNIWAVGINTNEGASSSQTLVERWNGNPNIPFSARGNLAGIELAGVSAISADDVWAVSRIATEHWDGTRWRIVASPRVRRNTIAALSAVAAIGPRDAWAVGNVLYETVAAHWNGVRWGIAPSPNTNI